MGQEVTGTCIQYMYGGGEQEGVADEFIGFGAQS